MMASRDAQSPYDRLRSAEAAAVRAPRDHALFMRASSARSTGGAHIEIGVDPAIPHMSLDDSLPRPRCHGAPRRMSQHDNQIEPKRAVLQIVEVVFELRPHRIGLVGVSLG